MTSIQPLWSEMPLRPIQEEAAPPKPAAPVNPFTDIFASAIDAVKETDAQKTSMQYLMSTGQLDNPVPLILAANKAELSVSLLMQLRSKAMDAYNELTRISM